MKGIEEGVWQISFFMISRKRIEEKKEEGERTSECERGRET